MGSTEIEDEEFDEALGLLHSPIPNHTDFEEETPLGRQNSAKAWVWWIITMVLVAVTSRIVYHKEQQWLVMQQPSRFPPKYECPVLHGNHPEAKNHQETSTDNQALTGDSEEYTFKELKENLREWTVNRIAPHVLDEQMETSTTTTTTEHRQVSILEASSSTLGSGLFLTLLLLEEMQAQRPNPTQFWVSGHDQNPSPLSFSSFRDDKGMNKLPNVHLGVFCGVKESPLMNLSYIPQEMFDVVYSDHIPSLSNPLDFVEPSEALFAKYLGLCTSDEQDAQGKPLREVALEKQEALLARWLGDLVRVLRPGGLVIVENIAVPLCESSKPEIGVHQEWWSAFILKNAHQLSMDPATTTLEEDHLRNWRYHVVMRKKE